MHSFLYNIGDRRYNNVQIHYDVHELLPRIHKSSPKVPNRSNVLSTTDIQNVVSFITGVAGRKAISLLGRMPYFCDYIILNQTLFEIFPKWSNFGKIIY